MAIKLHPRALVVDDRFTARTLMKIHLERWNFEVLEAESGQEAIERCAEELLDLIVMDLHMPPGIDGVETTRLIRQQGGPNARAPVILYTSDSDFEDRQVWSAAGFDGHISKMVPEDVLVKMLRRWQLIDD